MRAEPPRIATAILLRFGHPSSELRGDLAEEFSERRSRAWYWRQVIAALFVGGKREVHARPLLTLIGLVTGPVVGYATFKLAGIAEGQAIRGLWHALRAFVDPPVIYHFQLYSWVSLLPLFMMHIVIAAAVALVHRRHRVIPLLAVIVMMLSWHLPRLMTLAANTLEHERFAMYLAVHVASMLVTLSGLVVGGLLVAPVDPEQSAKA